MPKPILFCKSCNHVIPEINGRYDVPQIHMDRGCVLVIKTETVEVNKERLFYLLMKLANENLPLFSSDRLKGLHKDVKLLLGELINQEGRVC